jgi:hypothetical protein
MYVVPLQKYQKRRAVNCFPEIEIRIITFFGNTSILHKFRETSARRLHICPEILESALRFAQVITYEEDISPLTL